MSIFLFNNTLIQFQLDLTTYSDSGVKITFPVSYTEKPFVVTQSGDGANNVASNSYVGNGVSSRTKTSFKVNANSCTPKWSWLSIGI